MHQRLRFILPVFLLLGLAGSGYWYWSQQNAIATAAQRLAGSGTIEVEEILITSEIAGRVRSLNTNEGDTVAAKQTVAQLDTDLLTAQLEQARAAVAVAEANLAQLQAGNRAEEITSAQAAVAQAIAQRDGAAQALENALLMVANPQELNAQVAQLQANRDTARRQLERLRAGSRPEDLAVMEAALRQANSNLQTTRDRLSATKTQAEIAIGQAADGLVQAQARYAQAKANWDYIEATGNEPMNPSVTDPRTGKSKPNKASDGAREAYYAQFIQAEAAMHAAEAQVEQAKVAYEAARQAEITGIQTAEAQVQTAQANLQRAQTGPTREELAQAETAVVNAQRILEVTVATRANPQQLKAAADNAQTQFNSAESQLAQAQARFELAEAGARREQIQAATAQVAQARAAAKQIEVQLAKTTLQVPRAGMVLSRPIHEGEHVTPGMPLLTIGALDTARLTIYIPESQIGRVRTGQIAEITVNSFPGRTFNGRVTFIAQQAQFTPRNVQTQEERATTVFAVRIELDNADGALKPGMPADAILVE